MLSRLKNWAAGAAIVGGVVAAGYWANNEYLAWRDRTEATEVLHKRYNVTQDLCNSSVAEWMQVLEVQIYDATPVESLMEQLRSSKQGTPLSFARKSRIWDELKVQGFTRTLSGLYATAMLVTYLRIEFNVLERNMYLQSILRGGKPSPPSDTNKELRARFLASIDFFVHSGLPAVVDAVRVVVDQVLSRFPLKQLCTYEALVDLLTEIRMKLETEGEGEEAHHGPLKGGFSRFFMPPSDEIDATFGLHEVTPALRAQFRLLAAEATERLDDPLCIPVMQDNFSKLFRVLEGDLLTYFKNASATAAQMPAVAAASEGAEPKTPTQGASGSGVGGQASADDDGSAEPDEPIELMPQRFAKIIPNVTVLIQLILASEDNTYVDALTKLPASRILDSFSAVIFCDFDREAVHEVNS